MVGNRRGEDHRFGGVQSENQTTKGAAGRRGLCVRRRPVIDPGICDARGVGHRHDHGTDTLGGQMEGTADPEHGRAHSVARHKRRERKAESEEKPDHRVHDAALEQFLGDCAPDLEVKRGRP